MPSILILGAHSDIAQALAHQYAKAGYAILLAARQAKERLVNTQSDLKIRYNVEVYLYDLDIVDVASQQMFLQEMGELPDVVISVVGFMPENNAAVQNAALAAQTLEVNYLGPVQVLNALAIRMKERKSGTIVGISSVAGERGRQSNFIYGSAKAGFSTYLDGLRHYLRNDNVHVMTVKPGFMNTAMTAHLTLPQKLTAEPNQVGKAIFKAAKKRKNTLYVLPVWRYIMCIIRNLPEFIFLKTKL